MFTGFTPKTLSFLKQLKRNNNRDWFQDHKQQYLDEVMQLSDRIVVLLEGEVMGELSRDDFDVQAIGLLMSGVRDGAPS